MIYDTLDHMDNYKDMPQLYRALQVIRDTDFSKLEDGTYEVDGFEFRFRLSSYTVDHVNERPEAHREFIDVQYLITGREMVGIAPLKNMHEEVASRPEDDIWFYKGAADYLPLGGDRFMVFFPNDAHAPASLTEDGPSQVRKCLFKIHL